MALRVFAPMPAPPGGAPDTATPGTARAGSRVRRFLADEDGSFAPFALYMVLAVLMAVGIGISVQLAEVNRARMQNTLDGAVLAAADLDQMLDSKAVMEDHFERAGMAAYLTGTDVQSGQNFRTVTATAAMDLPTFFMIEPPNWVVQAAAQANETVENIEISMVLDISGSMRFGDQITPLRAAARNFIDMVMAGDRPEDTTVSIVPYAGQVNPGPELFAALGGIRTHANSSCLLMEDADFLHTGLPTQSTTQVPHFMKWTIDWNYMDWGWCPSDDTAILPLSSDPAELKTFIDEMRLHDGTGTQNGMKWGLALLDPTSEPVLDTLFPDTAPPGHVGPWTPPTGHDRPLDWEAESSKKVIVLMTDGRITDQFEPIYTGLRDIDGDDDDNETGDRDDIDGIDHDLLNAKVETGQQGAIGGDQRTTTRAHNAQNFFKVCDLARENRVTVFTISFNAPSGAADEMRYCATTPGHFYEVDEVEIGAAFSSIARQIAQLRLTQ